MVIQNYPTSVVVAIDLGRDSSTTVWTSGGSPRSRRTSPSTRTSEPVQPDHPDLLRLPSRRASRCASMTSSDAKWRRWSTAAGAGYYIETWNGRTSAGSAVTSGVYFYRLEAKGSPERRQRHQEDGADEVTGPSRRSIRRPSARAGAVLSSSPRLSPEALPPFFA